MSHAPDSLPNLYAAMRQAKDSIAFPNVACFRMNMTQANRNMDN
jgi:hypothetical protein